MSKLVKLDGYKNSLDRQKAKTMRRDLMKDAKSCARNTGRVAGYCVVVWDSDANATVRWDTGSVFPGNVLPEYLKTSALRLLNAAADNKE